MVEPDSPCTVPKRRPRFRNRNNRDRDNNKPKNSGLAASPDADDDLMMRMDLEESPPMSPPRPRSKSPSPTNKRGGGGGARRRFGGKNNNHNNNRDETHEDFGIDSDGEYKATQQKASRSTTGGRRRFGKQRDASKDDLNTIQDNDLGGIDSDGEYKATQKANRTSGGGGGGGGLKSFGSRFKNLKKKKKSKKNRDRDEPAGSGGSVNGGGADSDYEGGGGGGAPIQQFSTMPLTTSALNNGRRRSFSDDDVHVKQQTAGVSPRRGVSFLVEGDAYQDGGAAAAAGGENLSSLCHSGGGGDGTGIRRRYSNDDPPSSNSRGGGVSFDLRTMSSAAPSSTEWSSASGSTTMMYGRPGSSMNMDEGQRARYSVHTGRRGKNKPKFRVRPYHAFSEPRYLTEEEIYTDSTKPSAKYEMLTSYLAPTVPMMTKNVQVSEEINTLFGSPEMDGRIGAVRVEVLGCVSIARQKPDLGVYLVCGDSAFCTDVIQGYRSPMWPSTSRRACVFPIHHVYTQIYAGVFDVKVRKNKENDVFCGRVAIDVASLRPGTEYDITFPLRASSFVYDRRKRGVIRLRFSLHLFSERAAVMSYFQKPRGALVEGCPTIPCADPKTFRNVAVTVYGHDLPGKYSRNAFRATMREFNLYHQNIRVVAKHLVLEAVMYDKPIISVYLFIAGMHCVLSSTVSHIPPYFIGYVLILYIENYFHYVEQTAYNEGYRQLTIPEVFKALIFTTARGERYFEPVLVKKKAKNRSGRSSRGKASALRRMQDSDTEYDPSGGGAGAGAGASADEKENELVDHREFPFSDREAYPRFGVENALAPSTKNAGASNTRLHGRLSVYYTPTPENQVSPTNATDMDEDESSDDSGSDDQSVTGFGDDMFNMDDDIDEDDIEALDQRMTSGGDPHSVYGYGNEPPADPAALIRNAAKNIRRLRVGPPQDSDVKGRKIPPQVHLKRVEHMLHKATKSLSVELITPPAYVEESTPAVNNADDTDGGVGGNGMPAPPDSVVAKKRKLINDEFDKLLGLNAKSANPLNRILSSFLGPLMRMIRIVIFLMRIAFSAATWRDPYLSFWVLCALVSLGLILMVFPWRAFFFFSTLICLGPQNVFVKRYLEKRAIEKELKKLEEAAQARKEHMESDMNMTSSTGTGSSGWMTFSGTRTGGTDVGSSSTLSTTTNDKASKGFFQRTMGVFGQATQAVGSATSATAKATAKATAQTAKTTAQVTAQATRSAVTVTANQVRITKRPSLENCSSFQESERPAFTSNPSASASYDKRYRPRAVTVPYSPLKKSRFFDWPPDPTVSRATPLQLQEMPSRQGLNAEQLEHHQQQQQQQLQKPMQIQTPTQPVSDLLPGFYAHMDGQQKAPSEPSLQQLSTAGAEEPMSSSLRQRRFQKQSKETIGVPLYI